MEALSTYQADTLFNTPMKEQKFVVEGLIPLGLTLLAGGSKIGKSWLVLFLALKVSQGETFWDGVKTTQSDVLYISLEDNRDRIQRRLFKIADEAPESLRFCHHSDPLGDGLEAQIQDHLAKYPNTRLIIIDTMQRVRQDLDTGGNLYFKDYEDMAKLKKLADDNGIALLLVHHVNKKRSSDDPFESINGSNGIMGAADTTLLLRKKNRASIEAELYVTGRDVKDQMLCLALNDCTWEMIRRCDPQQEEKASVPKYLYRLALFLRENPKWSGNATELLEALNEGFYKPQSVRKHLAQFYERIFKPRGIVYASKKVDGKRWLLFRYRADKDEIGRENDELYQMDLTDDFSAQDAERDEKDDRDKIIAGELQAIRDDLASLALPASMPSQASLSSQIVS